MPQVPRLFSATLRDNLTVGLAANDPSVTSALRRAAFDGNLQEIPARLDTVVGPREVRLSGGQLQRGASGRAGGGLGAARARRSVQRAGRRDRAAGLGPGRPGARRDRAGRQPRAGALERTDQVVVLTGGRVVASGAPEALRAAGVELVAVDGATPPA